MGVGCKSNKKSDAFADRLRGKMHESFGAPSDDASVIIAKAPGRVNLLGGHTDYTEGFVLPTTIDRTVHIALQAREGAQDDDCIVRLHSLNFEETVEYAPGADEKMRRALPGWARYVTGVVEALREHGHAAVEGFDAAIEGDVPLGAGLSSSAALEVATAVGISALFSLDLKPVETAKLCQHVEQEYVGVECGIMDQFASRLGRSDHALFLDCRSLAHQHVPLPLEDVCLVVADSGVRRELAASKYNERRRECEEATRLFQQESDDTDVQTLRDVSESMLEAHGSTLSPPLLRRARHVVRENQRVKQGVELLADGKTEAFGQLMNASHDSLRDDYDVSCAELDCLAHTARDTPGVMGARMTGAGFGGCTVTLARPEAAPRLKRSMKTSYEEGFDRTPEIYVIERNLEAGLL